VDMDLSRLALVGHRRGTAARRFGAPADVTGTATRPTRSLADRAERTSRHNEDDRAGGNVPAVVPHDDVALRATDVDELLPRP
jgi:hypothetical protein